MGGEDRLSTLESVRETLIRLEDSIIFRLIERAKYPLNSKLYEKGCSQILDFSGSLFDYILQQTESLQAKLGRYKSPEEHPFFPDNLPEPVLPSGKHPSALHPAAVSVNVSKDILDMYINKLLPLFAAEGDDGDYVHTAACDLDCLQAISRRIHVGKYVAEVKFKDAPDEYTPLICAKDTDALMKLLTFPKVEEMIKKRVEKKAMVFSQDVSLCDDSMQGKKYKLEPSVASHLYGEWLMPLTKVVEVEYLLRRLD